LAEQHAGAASGADSELDGLAARLATLRIEAEDLAGELRRYLEGLDAEPGRLEDVEARLDRYDRLKRKHGGSVEAVLAHAARGRAARDRLGRRALAGDARADERRGDGWRGDAGLRRGRRRCWRSDGPRGGRAAPPPRG